MVFVEGGKPENPENPENPEKNAQSRDENHKLNSHVTPELISG